MKKPSKHYRPLFDVNASHDYNCDERGWKELKVILAINLGVVLSYLTRLDIAILVPLTLYAYVYLTSTDEPTPREYTEEERKMRVEKEDAHRKKWLADHEWWNATHPK